MAKGYFKTWPDAHMRSFGDDLQHAAEIAAARVGGWRIHNVRLGRHVIALRSTHALVHSMFARTMTHLASSDAPDLTISVVDSASTGVQRPVEPAWAEDTWRHESDATVLYQDRDHDSLSWTDAERGVGLWWLADEASIPAWERPAPLRALIDRLLAPRGVTLVHAGIVGDDRGGVMLAGRGGSGKSTSVVACIAGGLHAGGDDFLLVHNDERPIIGWSMYATARLLPHSPAWKCFDAKPTAIEMPRNPASEDENQIKRTVFLSEQFPHSVRDRFPVRAIAVPMVADSDATTAAPMRPAAALLALAPSSMLQLVDPHPAALTTISALVREVPCFSLHVGRDLAGVRGAVSDLLDAAGTS